MDFLECVEQDNEYQMEDPTGREGPDSDCEFLSEGTNNPIQEKFRNDLYSKNDYSLNSPLFDEVSDEMRSYLLDIKWDKVQRLTYTGKKSLDYLKLQVRSNFPQSMYSSQRLHKNLSTLYLLPIWRHNSNLSTITDHLCHDMEFFQSVISDYWRSLGLDVGMFTRNNVSRITLFDSQNPERSSLINSWWEKFYLLHNIILWVNSANQGERENLSSENTNPFTLVCDDKDKEMWIGEGNTGLDTRTYIGPGYCYLASHGLLMDRNFILMLKDIGAGRFTTLVGMSHRIDSFKGDDYTPVISEMWTKGDLIIEKHGNEAYPIIKMIEPLCNLQISKKAETTVPLLPPMTNFQQAMVEKMERLNPDHNPEIQAFFDHILLQEDPDLLVTMMSLFRLWGHPFVEYLQGLKKLQENVNCTKEVDTIYMTKLSSILVHDILRHKFRQDKKWYVDITQLAHDHLLYNFIETKTWPPNHVIESFGDNWDKLPVQKCFQIPITLPPSSVYDDKSYSMGRKEVIHHVSRFPKRPIPSRKVLETLLKKDHLQVEDFLNNIDREGLDKEDLVIGLKGKERELKVEGRFFALMSWKLREYFVITELLIKDHILPLYKGITMTDDFGTLIKKLINATSTHGRVNHSSVTIANHLDYSKWNNHQREESTSPIFYQLDRFFGFGKVFSRTHSFFQQSLVYYSDRPDLMEKCEDSLKNRDPENTVCWEGQLGGLEGLRQKGWSLISLLMLVHESRFRNTKVTLLTQGDNQIVLTNYALPPFTKDELLTESYKGIHKNNEALMKGVVEATRKMGLLINYDETIQSPGYLIYGKIPIFSGRIINNEFKRWARVFSGTNDQIPTLHSCCGNVGATALGVNHFSLHSAQTIVLYGWYMRLSLILISKHHPLVQSRLLIPHPDDLGLRKKQLLVLWFLDPSLGGCAGTNLARFAIRSFPDPVSESLSFWKRLHNTTLHPEVKHVAEMAGNPRLDKISLENFSRLIEKPNSLNLHKWTDPSSIIRGKITQALMSNCHLYKNQLISKSIQALSLGKSSLMTFLHDITPLFPRFLSEFYSSTFEGMAENLSSLFRNSRTIRNIFKRKLESELDDELREAEKSMINHLFIDSLNHPQPPMWICSSFKADQLRLKSWGRTCLGATVPHPLELLKYPTITMNLCLTCEDSLEHLSYIKVTNARSLPIPPCDRGRFQAYLGSTTKEGSELFHPWEKSSDVSFLHKALRLRNVIGWFVEDNSNLSKSIFSNLRSLTGTEWEESTQSYKRSGTSLHRFRSERQSAGGYLGNNPFYYEHVYVTSDNFKVDPNCNYDFLYQSLLLFSQYIHVESLLSKEGSPSCTHYHVGCPSCIRTIQDPTLDSSKILELPDRSPVFFMMVGRELSPIIKGKKTKVERGSWRSVNYEEKSFHIGRTSSLIHTTNTFHGGLDSEELHEFPQSIVNGVSIHHYLLGVCQGLIESGGYRTSFFRDCSTKNLQRLLFSQTMLSIDSLCSHPPFQSLLNSSTFQAYLRKCPHSRRCVSMYTSNDLRTLGRQYFSYLITQGTANAFPIPWWSKKLWIFSNFQSLYWKVVLQMGGALDSSSEEESSAEEEREVSESIRDREAGSVVKGGSMRNVLLTSLKILEKSANLRRLLLSLLDRPDSVP